MPVDRAAILRCLIALAALSAGSLALFSATSHDQRRVVIVRAPSTPALASVVQR